MKEKPITTAEITKVNANSTTTKFTNGTIEKIRADEGSTVTFDFGAAASAATTTPPGHAEAAAVLVDPHGVQVPIAGQTVAEIDVPAGSTLNIG